MFALFVKRFKHFAGLVQWRNRFNSSLEKRYSIAEELRLPLASSEVNNSLRKFHVHNLMQIDTECLLLVHNYIFSSHLC